MAGICSQNVAHCVDTRQRAAMTDEWCRLRKRHADVLAAMRKRAEAVLVEVCTIWDERVSNLTATTHGRCPHSQKRRALRRASHRLQMP